MQSASASRRTGSVGKSVLCAATAGLFLITHAGGATQPLTSATYRAHADAICATASRRTAALPSGLTLRTAIADGLEIVRSAFISLSRLTPPPKLENLRNEVLANIESGLRIVSGLLNQ